MKNNAEDKLCLGKNGAIGSGKMSIIGNSVNNIADDEIRAQNNSWSMARQDDHSK